MATLEEAIAIRKEFKSIPILVLGHINKEHIKEAIEYNITITIHSEDCLEEILPKFTWIKSPYKDKYRNE